jgi:Domain of unknown function (DUF5615)
LSGRHHEAWTAQQAGIADAADIDLIAYAHHKKAILVTTNRDCAQTARRQASARVVWLQVTEPVALAAMQRAVTWLRVKNNQLPAGMVLRIATVAEPRVLPPRQ